MKAHFAFFIFLIFSSLQVFADGTEPARFSAAPASYELRRDYSHFDPDELINPLELYRALQFYEVNYNRIQNKNYITLIDFSLHSTQPRLFMVNMRTGSVRSYLVAVGQGSDPDGDGNADRFSNVVDSHMSSLGFYLTDDVYTGGNGRSLRLHGLNRSNSNAYQRLIVIHGADYVSESRGTAGRSHGCPAVDRGVIDLLINNLHGGSLLYIYQSSEWF